MKKIVSVVLATSMLCSTSVVFAQDTIASGSFAELRQDIGSRVDANSEAKIKALQERIEKAEAIDVIYNDIVRDLNTMSESETLLFLNALLNAPEASEAIKSLGNKMAGAGATLSFLGYLMWDAHRYNSSGAKISKVVIATGVIILAAGAAMSLTAAGEETQDSLAVLGEKLSQRRDELLNKKVREEFLKN